jgi:hypothetical protein
MNRPAGEIRRSSTLVVNNRATLIRTLYRKANGKHKCCLAFSAVNSHVNRTLASLSIYGFELLFIAFVCTRRSNSVFELLLIIRSRAALVCERVEELGGELKPVVRTDVSNHFFAVEGRGGP